MTNNKMRSVGVLAAAAAFQYALSRWLARVSDGSFPPAPHRHPVVLIPQQRPAQEAAASPQLAVGSR